MKTFLEWNDTIAQHFFRPENAGRTVYLDATEELIQALGADDGSTSNDFIAAMRSGPPWAKSAGLCQTALQALRDWRRRELRYPPYVGYLALFVLAGAREGDFVSHAYYPRLRELLGEPAIAGQYRSFDQMFELWDDLERWLNREQGGSLGLLRTDIAGSKLHVGLPWAQAILTARERDQLHDLFAEANLDPASPPADAELARIIRARGQGLRPRTLAALQANQLESDYGSVLLDRILEELESWEEIPEPTRAADKHARSGAIVLCLRLDRSSRTALFDVRLRLRAFPEDCVAVLDGSEYTFRELASGYSSVLLDSARQPLNGVRFDWRRPMSLLSRTGDVLARSAAADVRIFTDGAAFGVNGYIEARSFDPTRPFAIAATGPASPRIRSWGAETWSDFREEQVVGAPSGWDIFTGARAGSDELIREHVPQLSFAKRLRRIRLEGGLKIPATQFYFRFAPPSIRVEGAAATALVRFNDSDSIARDASGAFRIPEQLLTENAVRISCDDHGVQLQRTVYLRDDIGNTMAAADVVAYTVFGAREEAGTGGTELGGVPATADRFIPLPLIPLEPEEHAILVGASPGQVARYDANITFAPWDPAWVVVYHRRRAHAHFIGHPPHPPGVSPGAKPDRRSRDEWEDVLWHQRMRIVEPKFEPARRLWRQYQQYARNG